MHASSIVHRDIKPANILLDRGEDGGVVARLTDFGIMRIANADADMTRLTQDGMLMGTPAFMAPEQAASASFVGPAADLYAVGVCLYWLLAKRMPFDGPFFAVIVRKTAEPAPVPENVEAWSPGLWPVVAKLIERQPEDRYAFAADAIEALGPFAAAEPIVLERTGAPSARLGKASVVVPRSPCATVGDTVVGVADDDGWWGIWGREAIVAELEAAAKEVEGGEAKALALTGSMGSGKSTLAARFAHLLAQAGRFRSLYVECGRSLGMSAALRGSLERLLDAVGANAASVEAKARELLRQLGETDEAEVQELLQFLRPPSAAAVDGFDALARHVALYGRLVRRLAARRPVLLFVDDIDRGGEDGFRALEQLMRDAEFEPMGLLVLATGEGDAVRGALARRTALRNSVRVVEVGAVDPYRLADGLRAEYRLGHEVAERIVGRASGNPLFARLLAQAVADGADTEPGHDSVDVPAQLEALLGEQVEARLASLADTEALRKVLARFAILGRVADVDELAALCEDVEGDFDDHLDHLIAAGLVVEAREGARVRWAQELVRDVVLGGVSHRRARSLHRRAAELRIAAVEAGAPVVPEIGAHLAAAGDEAGAVEWWLRAAKRAEEAGELRAAFECSALVVAAISEDDPRAAGCLLTMARGQQHLGDGTRAIELARKATRGGDPATTARALALLASCEQERQNMAGWSAAIEELQAVAEGAEPEVQRVRDRALLFWLNRQGDTEQSRALAARMLEDADRFGDGAYVRVRNMWACHVSRDRLEPGVLAEARAALEPVFVDPDVDVRTLVSGRRMVMAHDGYLYGDRDAAVRICEDNIATTRKAGQWADFAMAHVDKVMGELVAGTHEGFVEAIRGCRQTVADAGTPWDGDRLRCFDLILPFVFDVGPRDAIALAAMLDPSVNTSALPIAGWVHLALASDAARRGDMATWLRSAQSIESLVAWGLPLGLVENAIGDLLDNLPSDAEAVLGEAARVVDLARRCYAIDRHARGIASCAALAARIDAATASGGPGT
ncbi:MAG: AAA family ATPase [Sandaracinaceae bacterium]|nr:AAA family ATPase [Sandaracinaceae bacterium]